LILDLAKSVPIETEIARRGIRLVGHGAERSGACPRCGGRDRFSINIAKGLFNCRGCVRGGDVVDLVQFLDGVDHKTAIRALAGADVRNLVRHTEAAACHQIARPPKAVHSDAENTERALRIWANADHVGAIAKRYLDHRRLEAPDHDGALRYHAACPFGTTAHPALIALFRGVISNAPKAIHRIALNADGTLIEKRMLGSVGGCAVKLDCNEDVEQGLTVSEGVETGLAGRMLGFRPCWSLGSSGAIARFEPLAGITALTIITDNDEPDARGRQAGQAAALACSEHWRDAGVEVTRILPRAIGADMADIIIEQQGGSRYAS
jgi:CHC2 zinc finger/Toprim domain